jgi:hypothetical protein
MAVISKSQTSKKSDDENKYEPETIDLSNLDKIVSGETLSINKDADAWERLSPPPCPSGNRYHLVLFPAKEGTKRREEEKGNPNTSYYTCDLECKIIDSKNKEFDGVTVYVNGLHSPSTKVPRRREISTMAGLMIKLGQEKLVNSKMSHGDLLKNFIKVLKSEPKIWVELDWEATSKNDKDRNGFGKRIFATYTDFPVLTNEDGEEVLDENGEEERKSSVMITNDDGGREEINARLVVREWIGSKIDKEGEGKGGRGNSGKNGKGKIDESQFEEIGEVDNDRELE